VTEPPQAHISVERTRSSPQSRQTWRVETEYDAWKRDASLLAELGRGLFAQHLKVNVRLPGELARKAVEAWERDDVGESRTDETADQIWARKRAAALALIGLSVQQRGVWHGDEVEVGLDPWNVGTALDAAVDHGLLIDVASG
jgi:hypothetical protein